MCMALSTEYGDTKLCIVNGSYLNSFSKYKSSAMQKQGDMGLLVSKHAAVFNLSVHDRMDGLFEWLGR